MKSTHVLRTYCLFDDTIIVLEELGYLWPDWVEKPDLHLAISRIIVSEVSRLDVDQDYYQEYANVNQMTP